MFSDLFGLSPSIGKIDVTIFRKLLSAERLFFGTLDDDIRGFTIVALARAVLGRRTGGLFLHPNSCFGSCIKAKVKWLLFAFLSRFPGVTILSILPYELMPELREVSSAYVHDPQFWDQLDAPPSVDDEVVRQLHEAAAGRPILGYLGSGTPQKAFPFLAAIATEPGFIDRIMVVAAGKMSDSCQAAADQLRNIGAAVWQRFVSDEEMAAIYSTSRWIWNSYAPGYEQASGIFGRAVQQGRPVAIRHDSVTLAYYTRLLRHPAVRLPDDAPGAATRLIAAINERSDDLPQLDETALILRNWKTDFIAAVNKSMQK